MIMMTKKMMKSIATIRNTVPASMKSSMQAPTPTVFATADDDADGPFRSS